MFYYTSGPAKMKPVSPDERTCHDEICARVFFDPVLSGQTDFGLKKTDPSCGSLTERYLAEIFDPTPSFCLKSLGKS